MAQNMLRVRAVSTGWEGGPGLNTFYFLAGTATPAPDPTEDIANTAVTRVRAAFAAASLIWPISWTVSISPTVDVIRDTDGELMNSFTTTPVLPVQGTNTLGFGPIATGLLVRLGTGVFSGGKRIQGRHFLSPVCNSIDGNGTPTSGILSEGAKFMFEMGNAGISGVPRVVVWRRPRKVRLVPPLPARAGEAAVVSAYTMPDKFAVLRSRRD